jgi:hypothetical protein
MALCPFAVNKLLPESATQPAIVPRIVILHSAAGRGSLYNFFKNSSSLESHFWVSSTGVIEQYMDTGVRADANRNANGFAVSIETESSPEATERWTPEQAAAIVRLTDWLCSAYAIPRRLCDRWDGSGIGYHVQFGAPGPWTPVAKSCPGPARIAQMPEIIAAVQKASQPVWVAPRYPLLDGPFHEGDKNPGAQQAKVLLKEAGFSVPGMPLWTWTQTFGKSAVAATKNAQAAYWRNKGLSAVDAAKKASGVMGPVTWDWVCDVIKVLKAQGRA